MGNLIMSDSSSILTLLCQYSIGVSTLGTSELRMRAHLTGQPSKAIALLHHRRYPGGTGGL